MATHMRKNSLKRNGYMAKLAKSAAVESNVTNQEHKDSFKDLSISLLGFDNDEIIENNSLDSIEINTSERDSKLDLIVNLQSRDDTILLKSARNANSHNEELVNEGNQDQENEASDDEKDTKRTINRNNKYYRKSTPKMMLPSQTSLMSNVEDENTKTNKSKIPRYSNIKNGKRSALLEAKNAYETSIDEQIQKIKQNFNPVKIGSERKHKVITKQGSGMSSQFQTSIENNADSSEEDYKEDFPLITIKEVEEIEEDKPAVVIPNY